VQVAAMSDDVASNAARNSDNSGFEIAVTPLPDDVWRRFAEILRLPESARPDIERLVSHYKFSEIFRARVAESARRVKSKIEALRTEAKLIADL
jgi:hypothetical protein